MMIAFYKGKSRLFNKLVSWWLRGNYSHCELLLKHLDGNRYLCGSSSFMDGGVRTKVIDLHPDRWDVVKVRGDSMRARQWFVAHAGLGYDVLGIIGFVWRRTSDSRHRWFCSESIAEALGYEDSWRFDPCTLAAAVKR